MSPAGRDAFLAASGTVEQEGLLRARVLALFLSAVLAGYAHASAMNDLQHEALAGLEGTVVA